MVAEIVMSLPEEICVQSIKDRFASLPNPRSSFNRRRLIVLSSRGVLAGAGAFYRPANAWQRGGGLKTCRMWRRHPRGRLNEPMRPAASAAAFAEARTPISSFSKSQIVHFPRGRATYQRWSSAISGSGSAA
jgi:hypothetical protein